MANDENDKSASKAAPSAMRRSVPYVVFLAVIVALLIYFSTDSYKINTAISGLHSDNPATRRERLTIIRTHPNKALVNEKLQDALDDESQSWRVRRTCAAELLSRERLTELEQILKSGSLRAKTVVLHVLHNKQFFKTSYLENEEYDIYGTLRAWLTDSSDTHRAEAIQVTKLLNWTDGMELIRPLLRRSDDKSVHPVPEGHMLQAATSAVSFFDDCESVPALQALVEGDPDGKVRMRALQEVHRVVFERDSCPGELPEDEMKRLIMGRLNDDYRATRMAAMILYKKQPAWAAESEAVIRDILEDTSKASPERRLALEVLVSISGDDFLKTLPRWFYDKTPEVRSSAAQAVNKFDQRANPFLGSLIGVVRNERENRPAFDSATNQLHRSAGMWKGLPRELLGAKRNIIVPILHAMFESGVGADIKREDFARDWFEYHAQQLGLDEAQVTAALAVYDAFWKAADANDVAGAKAALEGDSFDKQGLFADARGWTQANE